MYQPTLHKNSCMSLQSLTPAGGQESRAHSPDLARHSRLQVVVKNEPSWRAFFTSLEATLPKQQTSTFIHIYVFSDGLIVRPSINSNPSSIMTLQLHDGRQRFMLIVVWWLLTLSCVFPHRVCAKTKRARNAAQLDRQQRDIRKACEAQIESQSSSSSSSSSQHIKEVDDDCTSSLASRENCILKCMEPTCYQQVYANDPLEEGELDHVRGRVFRTCHKNIIREETRRRAEQERFVRQQQENREDL